MKPIRLNKNSNIRIVKCEGDFKGCISCGKRIKKGEVCLDLYFIGLHINCIDKFAKEIIKFKKKHIRDIMIESLTEKRK